MRALSIASQTKGTVLAQGGGIDGEDSVLSLTNCKVNSNKAEGATALGGGIYAHHGSVDVRNSEVKDNKANGTVVGQGGGIYCLDSFFTLLGSKVKGNKATTGFNDIFNGP